MWYPSFWSHRCGTNKFCTWWKYLNLQRLSLMYVLCLVAQSCPTLCDPIDCSLPDSSVHGDSPAKNTGWVAMLSLRGILPTSIALYVWVSKVNLGMIKIKEYQNYQRHLLVYSLLKYFSAKEFGYSGKDLQRPTMLCCNHPLLSK